MNDVLYIFLDEGGNPDFSPNGTKYFTISAISIFRPFDNNLFLEQYKYDCIEYGLEMEYFHCSEDNSYVRNKVFEIIADHKNKFIIDSIIVDKCKTSPKVRIDTRFYPEILGYLLRYIINKVDFKTLKEIVVITDKIPVNKKKKIIEKSIKQVLATFLPKNCKFRIYHHSSKSHYLLQVADYINSAIFKKWEKSDLKYYDIIRGRIRSEFDIFRSGAIKHY